MCGIIGVHARNGNAINELVRKQFSKQKDRGTDGFGLYDKDTNRLVRSASGKAVFKYLNQVPTTSMLFHHRIPTSIDNIKRACHPFSTKDYFDTNYLLIHNGHIRNSDTLKAEHEKLGIKYVSELPDGDYNDSEALAWDFALTMEGQQEAMKAEGAIAFICMAIRPGRKHDRLYFGRNFSNPLNMHLSQDLLMLSSEGKGKACEVDTLYTYDYVTGKVTSRAMEFPSYSVTTKSYSDAGYNQASRGYWYNGKWHSSLSNPLLGELDDDELDIAYVIDAADRLVMPPKVEIAERERDIRLMENKYMWRASGEFWVAYEDIEEAIELLSEAARFLAPEDRDTKGLLYTLGVLKEAKDNIWDNPKFETRQAIDEDYNWVPVEQEKLLEDSKPTKIGELLLH